MSVRRSEDSDHVYLDSLSFAVTSAEVRSLESGDGKGRGVSGGCVQGGCQPISEDLFSHFKGKLGNID